MRGKTGVRIYDYAGLNISVRARMFDWRCRGYDAVGYTETVPASAVLGWPAEVPLATDPLWKRNHCVDSFETPWISYWRICLLVPPGPFHQKGVTEIGREVQPRCFSIAVWKHFPKRRDDSLEC